MTLALDELEDCASQDSLEKAMDRKELAVPSTAFWNPCRKRNGWCS